MTYQLGAGSRAKLKGVHPDLINVVDLAITLTEQDFTVFDGVRTLEKQKELVRRGASKTMRSKHLEQPDGFGHAVDLVPYIDGELRWEWGAIYPIAFAVQTAARQLKVSIVWGGVWDRKLVDLPASAIGLRSEVKAYAARHPGPDFLDGPHFQLGGA